jgi:hypothetical protein
MDLQVGLETSLGLRNVLQRHPWWWNPNLLGRPARLVPAGVKGKIGVLNRSTKT